MQSEANCRYVGGADNLERAHGKAEHRVDQLPSWIREDDEEVEMGVGDARRLATSAYGRC